MIQPERFQAELAELVRAYESEKDNPRSIECHSSENCVECTFCRGCSGLLRCHYCVDCERCVLSTHCRSSKDLHSANHCVECERCSDSSYLVRSYDCVGSTYCFGCVGLVGKDFHILNEPYPRSEYFAVTAKLKAALRIP